MHKQVLIGKVNDSIKNHRIVIERSWESRDPIGTRVGSLGGLMALEDILKDIESLPIIRPEIMEFAIAMEAEMAKSGGEVKPIGIILTGDEAIKHGLIHRAISDMYRWHNTKES